MKNNQKIKILIRELKKYTPEKIILFGSSVRKDKDEFSDIDLMIIKETKKRFLQRLVEASKFIPEAIGKVDIFVYTPGELETMTKQRNPFIETALNEGRVIYEKK